jgi:hypothetical protein
VTQVKQSELQFHSHCKCSVRLLLLSHMNRDYTFQLKLSTVKSTPDITSSRSTELMHISIVPIKAVNKGNLILYKYL